MDRVDFFVSRFRGKVLNIGCFGSESYDLMLKSGYKNLYGLDLILEDSRRRIIKGDALEMRFKEKFDVIIAGELIEHFSLWDAKRLLENCFNALREKGELIITTPNKRAWSNRLFHRFDNANPSEYSGHLHVFEIKELLHLVEESGFAIKECFCLPYAREASPNHSNFVYFARHVIHHALPKGLQEQIVVLAEKDPGKKVAGKKLKGAS